MTDCNVSPSYQQQHHYPAKRKPKDSADSKRERKAAKTLAIITGAFVICWLPFFIMAILLSACSSYEFNEYVIAFFLWLGYFNSTLNPIIYTIFSPEFRHAFKRILCGRRSLRRRNRHFGVRYLQQPLNCDIMLKNMRRNGSNIFCVCAQYLIQVLVTPLF